MAAVEEENVNTNGKTLSQLFDQAMKAYDEICKTDEATNSTNVQIQIKLAISLFEEATRLVSACGMFSTNEGVEEVPTSNLKYFLLPALLGTLNLKLCVDNRMEIVRIAEIYFKDFLMRCKNYGITDVEIPNSEKDEDKVETSRQPARSLDLLAMARDRNAKIENYKQKKQLESELESLRLLMSSANITDEETERKYYLTLMKSYVRESVDELNSLEMEKPILEHMAKMRQGDSAANKENESKRPQKKPLQAIIITRDEIQKKVFGAGYPSLPALTVQEFYEQRIKEGVWKDPSQQSSKCLQDMVNNPADDSEEIEKEELIEQDDPEMLKQTRDWDDYKDTHRRGWGNRMNRS